MICAGEDSPISQLLLSVMGAFAEFERSLIRERQKEGIELAEAKNLYKGRKPSLDEAQVLFLKEQIALGIPKAKLARDFNVSRRTIYQYI
ncbi:MAG: helix-turn-helix domain-containing protein [Janthinobacterium lividum]